jgi:hypothetical protein
MKMKLLSQHATPQKGIPPREFSQRAEQNERGEGERNEAISGKTLAALFLVILLAGGLLRFWELGNVPPGLNQDEASIGLDAYSLFHFGVDRNAISFPVNFISWGSGMDALYIYLVLPFIGFGLSPLIERLPMAISGWLTLPLVFLIGRKCVGNRFGLLAMFFVAISPWHIMLSHWGLNDNILPFVFTLAVALLVYSRRENFWFPAAMAVFALSLYAYGVAYAAVPIFVVLASLYLCRMDRVAPAKLALGCLIFLVVALPILLFVAVNSLGWNTISWGAFTIPRLPVLQRYQHVGILFSTDLVKSLRNNSLALWNTLWFQTDGDIWNTIPRYGYAFPGALLMAAAGALAYFLVLRRRLIGPHWILPIWLVAAVSSGVALEGNINRLNLVFIPLLFMMAAAVEILFRRLRIMAWAALAGYLVMAFLFAQTYLGGRYKEMAAGPFYDGLIPALQSAIRYPDAPICVTDDMEMPYVYALWVDPGDPREYLPTIEYADSAAQFRKVTRMGRFAFGLQNCSPAPDSIYVLKSETPPAQTFGYRTETYQQFHVYYPAAAGGSPKSTE